MTAASEFESYAPPSEPCSPLTQWSCDRCGQPVAADDSADDAGYVNWGRGVAPKIFHKYRCQDDNLSSSAAMRDFLGADGLANLTAMLSQGRLRVLHVDATPAGHCEFTEKMDDFVDFFRRMQIPGYEEARKAMGRADVWEQWSDSGEVAPYTQRDLKRFAEHK